MSDSAFKRAHRVGQMLQKELGDLLVNGIKDPRVGFATVTEVRPADDLRTARVFVSIYGTEETRQETLTALQEAAGFLKRELAHRVNLRFTPSLTFVIDPTLDQAERLEQLLAEAKHGPEAASELAEATAEVIPVKTARSELADTAAQLETLPKPKASRPRRSSGRVGRRGRKRNRGR